MPWFRFRYVTPEDQHMWIAGGRIDEPPTVEFTVELPDLAAAEALAEELRDRLVRESGAAWVWVTEAEVPAGAEE